MSRRTNGFANYTKPLLCCTALLAVACMTGRGGGGAAAAPSPANHRAAHAVRGLGPAPVDLGTASDFVILTKSGITNVPGSAIVGNLGVSPIAAAAITGFGLSVSAAGDYSTASQVSGQIFAASYTLATPAKLTAAIGDMHTAYLDAAGRTSPDYNELAGGHIGGLTLHPGLYKWTTAVAIPGDVTLEGGPDDVWIFQISGDVRQGSGARVILTGGAQAKNVFWQVAGVVALGTTAHMEGQILSGTAITMNTGASANGRLFAHTNVTLIMNTVVRQ
jgi:hypothetical protein